MEWCGAGEEILNKCRDVGSRGWSSLAMIPELPTCSPYWLSVYKTYGDNNDHVIMLPVLVLQCSKSFP